MQMQTVVTTAFGEYLVLSSKNDNINRNNNKNQPPSRQYCFCNAYLCARGYVWYSSNVTSVIANNNPPSKHHYLYFQEREWKLRHTRKLPSIISNALRSI